MNLEKLVFIDESGAKTNMTRLYGRAKAGQRAVDNAPAGHCRTPAPIWRILIIICIRIFTTNQPAFNKLQGVQPVDIGIRPIR